MQLLPLAIIHQNKIYRNHIISFKNGNLLIYPFERECEATRFISAIIIVSNKKAQQHIPDLPKIEEGYRNIAEIKTFFQNKDLYLHKKDVPTLICADTLGFKIL